MTFLFGYDHLLTYSVDECTEHDWRQPDNFINGSADRNHWGLVQEQPRRGQWDNRSK